MENRINERIAEIIIHLRITKNAFAKSIGKSASAINFMVEGKSKPNFEVLDAICDKYKEINPSWLLTGEGNMLKSTTTVKAPEDNYLNDYLEKLEEQFKRLLNQLETKDSQIQSLQEMLKMQLGKHRGVIKLGASRDIIELLPEIGETA